jgi:hypothetical protein
MPSALGTGQCPSIYGMPNSISPSIRRTGSFSALVGEAAYSSCVSIPSVYPQVGSMIRFSPASGLSPWGRGGGGGGGGW